MPRLASLYGACGQKVQAQMEQHEYRIRVSVVQRQRGGLSRLATPCRDDEWDIRAGAVVGGAFAQLETRPHPPSWTPVKNCRSHPRHHANLVTLKRCDLSVPFSLLADSRERGRGSLMAEVRTRTDAATSSRRVGIWTFLDMAEIARVPGSRARCGGGAWSGCERAVSLS